MEFVTMPTVFHSSELKEFGGILICPVCSKGRQITKGDINYYTVNGWEECCGQTMTLITAKHLKEMGIVIG